MLETKSTCPYCGVGCGVVIKSTGDQITGVRGDPDHPANFGRLCTKGSTLALALGYGLNHWDGLCCFLEDGRIEIDSNTVERSIRGLALSRKNALFAGHDRGAEGWAMIASLLETCKLNAVDPLAWTTDVLTKLVNRWPASRIDELMPWAYTKAR